MTFTVKGVRKIRRKKYRSYDYEEIYDRKILGEESIQEKIDQIHREFQKVKYKIKTYQCGDYLEADVFPVYEKKGQIPRKEKNKESREAQKNLNNKRSQRQLVRVINTNFKAGDLAVDLTYAGDYLPDKKRAKKDMTNFINRLKRWRKKNGYPPLKYIYVIEWLGEDEKGKTKKVRIHHHMIINDMDRDIVEKLWGKGRANTDRLQPDENGLVGKGMYIAKHCQKSAKKWVGSRNLKKPKVYESVTKLTRRKAEQLALNPSCWKEIFEKTYSNRYIFNDCERYISDVTGGFYLYARMRKRE